MTILQQSGSLTFAGMQHSPDMYILLSRCPTDVVQFDNWLNARRATYIVRCRKNRNLPKSPDSSRFSAQPAAALGVSCILLC